MFWRTNLDRTISPDEEQSGMGVNCELIKRPNLRLAGPWGLRVARWKLHRHLVARRNSLNLILIASIVMIVTPVAEDRSIPRFSLGMVLAASAGLRLSNYQGLEIPIRAWCSARRLLSR